MLDAVREGSSIAYDERRAPGVSTQYVAQPTLRIGVIARGASERVGLAGHHRQTGSVRRGIAVAPGNSEAPGIRACLGDGRIGLSEELLLDGLWDWRINEE